MNSITLPHTWREAAERAKNWDFRPEGVGGTRGATGQPRSGIASGGNQQQHDYRGQGSGGGWGAPRGGAAGYGGSGGGNNQRTFRVTHEDRYGKGVGARASNTDIHPAIRKLLQPLADQEGVVPLKAVLIKARTNFTKLKVSTDYEEGICPYFATGRCTNHTCTAAHLFGRETPNGWATNFCRICGDDARKVIEEKNNNTPNKRQRGYDK